MRSAFQLPTMMVASWQRSTLLDNFVQEQIDSATKASQLERFARVRGWILIVIGSGLTMGMAALACYLAATILYPTAGGSRWNGSHDFTVRVFGIFASILCFGLGSIINGVGFIRNKRAGKLGIVITLVSLVVTIWLGYEIINFHQTAAELR
jgi:hypothetical protein